MCVCWCGMVNGASKNQALSPHARTHAQAAVDVQAVQAPQAPEVSRSVAATPVLNIDQDINKVKQGEERLREREHGCAHAR